MYVYIHQVGSAVNPVSGMVSRVGTGLGGRGGPRGRGGLRGKKGPRGRGRPQGKGRGRGEPDPGAGLDPGGGSRLQGVQVSQHKSFHPSTMTHRGSTTLNRPMLSTTLALNHFVIFRAWVDLSLVKADHLAKVSG